MESRGCLAQLTAALAPPPPARVGADEPKAAPEPDTQAGDGEAAVKASEPGVVSAAGAEASAAPVVAHSAGSGANMEVDQAASVPSAPAAAVDGDEPQPGDTQEMTQAEESLQDGDAPQSGDTQEHVSTQELESCPSEVAVEQPELLGAVSDIVPTAPLSTPAQSAAGAQVAATAATPSQTATLAFRSPSAPATTPSQTMAPLMRSGSRSSSYGKKLLAQMGTPASPSLESRMCRLPHPSAASVSRLGWCFCVCHH